MGRRSVKFMMAIPIQSFKHAKVSLQNLLLKNLGCGSIYGIYVNVNKIMANKGIKI